MKKGADMSRLLPIAEQLIMVGALGSQMQQRKVDRTSQIIFGMAAVLGVLAVIFLIFALSYWLRAQYSPDVAALATAGVVLSLALLVTAIGYAYSTIRRTKINSVTDELKDKVMKAVEAVTEEMEDPIRQYPKSSVALATLAGYMVGNKV